MLNAVRERVKEPINLGSGEGIQIKVIRNNCKSTAKKIKWLTDKPMGDKKG